MGFLAAIPFRFYAYAAIAAVLGFLLWHDHHVSRLYKAEHAGKLELKASIAAERENTRKANESSQRYQSRLAALETERVTEPFPAISMCRNASVRPSPATPGSDAGAAPGNESATAVSADIGPAADLYGTRCEAVRVQLEELQRWVRERK